MPTSRAEFRAVARMRIEEARTLLAAQHWSGAYYLSGYAVECGLKAALVRQFTASVLPDKVLVAKAYTHSLESLVKLAGLEQRQAQAFNANPALVINWTVVKDWNEASRYRIWTQSDAEDMVLAITHRQNGVMKWLRGVW